MMDDLVSYLNRLRWGR